MKVYSRKIDNPAYTPVPGVQTEYVRIKKSLYAQGFRRKSTHKDTEVVAITKYWWDPYKISIVNGPRITIPAGHFLAVDCIYPKEKYVRVSVFGSDNNVAFYDDSIDDILGGQIEKLGG